mmetsp:Transcript_19663/g.30816  ORF Transcript_19663/g.30816 Transcript_19663/m.30816 type:complete len:248 (-) Transcript_19663:84-827(-)
MPSQLTRHCQGLGIPKLDLFLTLAHSSHQSAKCRMSNPLHSDSGAKNTIFAVDADLQFTGWWQIFLEWKPKLLSLGLQVPLHIFILLWAQRQGSKGSRLPLVLVLSVLDLLLLLLYIFSHALLLTDILDLLLLLQGWQLQGGIRKIWKRGWNCRKSGTPHETITACGHDLVTKVVDQYIQHRDLVFTPNESPDHSTVLCTPGLHCSILRGSDEMLSTLGKLHSSDWCPVTVNLIELPGLGVKDGINT